MKPTSRKGFVIVVATGFAAALLVIVLAIINMSCGEIVQTKAADDTERAYYVATSGAEMMYNFLKAKEGQVITWPQSFPAADAVIKSRTSGGATIGTFTATANSVSSDVFGIVSTGIVNGRSAKVTVKYGYDTPYTNGYPIGCLGAMSLSGTKWLVFRSWVRAEGPLASGSTITTNTFVKVSGDIIENQSFVQPTFWWSYDAGTNAWTAKTYGDVHNRGQGNFITDVDGDGHITIADAGSDPAKQAVFQADDINHDGVIDDKDAFVSYYTEELNKQGLNIGVGQSGYYNGDQNFNPTSVPNGTPIIFVNGTANILFSDTEWWGANVNHTIVATGDINIIQPTNNSNDTLTLISYGSVNTGGVRAFGGARGNFVVFACGDFNAYYGGRSNGTIFADGNVNVDTVLPIPGLLNRDLNKGTINWPDSSAWPLGLPPYYDTVTGEFRIKDESAGYVPVWQRE